ncbi:MAG: glycosyltransferase family 39 protein [Candidatus Omnitrophica bacterium]|nr:glycosyltransferase family 39 protein [Candidatus Omnitrophota bacterium]
MSDSARFGGDSWEYQSLGVNISKGFGFQIGGITNFSEYKFSPEASNSKILFYPFSPALVTGGEETLYDHFLKGGEYLFYRTPGYPLFLGSVYKFFGVHPLKVKVIQIYLLAFIAASLPLIARHYWGKLGCLSGFIWAFLFLAFFSPDPTKIITETLITFFLFILVIMLISWEVKASALKSFLLGLLTGLNVLTKGLNVFLPFILLCYLFLKTEKTKRLLTSFLFVSGIALLIITWSVYASSKTSRPITLATQQNTLLLDSNNEDTLSTGGWSPAWRKWDSGNLKYLYNRPEIKQVSPFNKLVKFLVLHYKDLPSLLINKLKRVFRKQFSCFLIVLGLLIYYLWIFILYKFKRKQALTIPYFPAIYFINFLLITLIFYGNYRFILPFMPFFILPVTHFCLLFLIFIFRFLNTQIRYFLLIK